MELDDYLSETPAQIAERFADAIFCDHGIFDANDEEIPGWYTVLGAVVDISTTRRAGFWPFIRAVPKEQAERGLTPAKVFIRLYSGPLSFQQVEVPDA